MRTALLLIVPVLPVAAAGQEPAPMFRGGPHHTGVYAPAGSTLVGLQWTFRTGGDVIASPTVADDVVYVASGDGGLYAVDLHTGAGRWRRELGAPSHATPAVAGSLVYAVTRDGRVQAVDRRNGGRVWETATGPDVPLVWGHESGDIYMSSPAVAGSLVVVGAGDGNVYALDRETGTIRWRAPTGGRDSRRPGVRRIDGRRALLLRLRDRPVPLALRDAGHGTVLRRLWLRPADHPVFARGAGQHGLRREPGRQPLRRRRVNRPPAVDRDPRHVMGHHVAGRGRRRGVRRQLGRAIRTGGRCGHRPGAVAGSN